MAQENDDQDREAEHAEKAAGDTEYGHGRDKQSAESTAASTTVQLPDGDSITAPTPQIADGDQGESGRHAHWRGFPQQGITIPPAGTAVAHPVDPSKLVAGDIGMFTDRQALALDRHRVWLNGRIEPLTGVSGPSFLGWLHPPDQGLDQDLAGSSANTPNGAAAPPPTRPATTVGY